MAEQPVAHTRCTIKTGGQRIVTHITPVIRARLVNKGYTGKKLRELRRLRGVGPVRAIQDKRAA